MMCYMDSTFCPGEGCQMFDGCGRALTQEVQDRAKALGLPIAQYVEPKKLHCYVEPTASPRDPKEDMLLADGFEEALIGTARRLNGPRLAVYDRTRCIEVLARDMSYEEAEEFFEFNVAGAWLGEGTPMFIDTDDL